MTNKCILFHFNHHSDVQEDYIRKHITIFVTSCQEYRENTVLRQILPKFSSEIQIDLRKISSH